MTQGAYTRCATYRCKKKTMPDSDYCKFHEAQEVAKMMEANPSLTKLIKRVVAIQLWEHGLIE